MKEAVKLHMVYIVVVFGTTAPSVPGPPHSRDF